MKKRIISAILAMTMLATSMTGLGSMISAVAATPFDGEAWYDQIDTVKINREDPRASFIPYQNSEIALDNETSALTKDKSRSTYYQLLNSDNAWNFKFAEKPATRLQDPDEELPSDGWDTSGWDTIKVPANWQTIKAEDGSFKYETPIYTNQTYPWANYQSVSLGEKVVAPTVKNGVGHYQRTFTLPDGWQDRNTFVSFQGVESAFYLWIDGKKVGYAEDSYTADDFNITPYLDPAKTEHTISLQVYRWSTGSYLENQDFIRLSGIFRDVYLYSKADVELRDFFVTTDIEFAVDEENKETSEAVKADLNLEADIRNLSKEVPGATSVEATLYNMDNTPVWDAPMVIAADMTGKSTVAVDKENASLKVTGSKEVVAPKLWYADDPILYKLLIELKDADGNVLETTVQRMGFRDIGTRVINEKGQEQMTINNKKIMLRGVNRHETSNDVGRALTEEIIIEDLKLMKQYNINAIRMSHYPEHVLTYELADEFGMYICDEANIESHSGATSSNIPSGYPIWKNSVMDRTQNMLERDKNHASVVIWSLGNEATYKTYPMDDTYCFYLSSQWILERDPSRLRKYERDNRHTTERETSMVDVRSVQYPTVSGSENDIKNSSNLAPYIWSEYAHSMGNGLGNFDEYWALARKYENASGGFIWDYKDQAIDTKIENTFSYNITESKTKTTAKVEKSAIDPSGLNGTKALKGSYVLPAEPALNAASDAITLEAWVNPASTGAHNTIISKGDNGYTLKINAQDGALEFFVDGYLKGTAMAELPDDLADGTWKHIVGTCENGKLKLFYNGEQLLMKDGSTEVATTAPTPLDNGELSMGVGATPGLGRNFNGLIDSIGVYKRALSAEEIKAAYEANSLSAAIAEQDITYKLTFNDEEVIRTDSTNYPEGTYFGWGGDWDDKIANDYDFCSNGVTYADGSPKPALSQVKKTHQEVSFYNDVEDGSVEKGNVRIVNEFLNTDLSEYTINWNLKEDNTVLKSGTLEDFSLAPLATANVQLDYGKDFEVKEGSDYVLAFSVTPKTKPIWANNADHEVAFEQFILDFNPTVSRPVLDGNNMPNLSVDDNETNIKITGENFEVSFDKETGFIDNYTVNGKKILEEGPKPNYYKAPIANESTAINNTVWANLKNAADGMTIAENGITVDVKEKVVTVNVVGTLTTMNDSTQTTNYMIYGNGDIVVDNTFTPNGNVGSLARAGMKMRVASDYENLEYYGRGPDENHVDRKTGSKLGVYKSTVEEQAKTKYSKPQNMANKTDVRWTSLVDESGDGIMISSAIPFESTATHYEEEDLAGLRHWYMAPKQDDTILTVDAKVRGLGNNSCAGDAALSPYQVPGNVSWSENFRISPITKQTDKMANSKLDTNSVYPVKNILVDGKAIKDFSPNVAEYTETLLIGTAIGIPQISVQLMDPNSTVEITQATEYPGTATVTATSSTGFTKSYTIHLKETDSIYASDMKWYNDNGGYFDNSRDKCSCGSALGVYVDGAPKYFNKGVGMHASASLELKLDGMNAQRFQTLAGVSADQTSTTANHVYVIFADGKEVYRSPEKKSKQNAEVIDLDVTGVSTLKLYTDAGVTDGNDHAIWADAKFVVGAQQPTVGAVANSLTVPEIAVDQTELVMPTVPEGFAVALTNSSNLDVIALDGTITPQDKETVVELTFTVSKAVARDGETASKTISVTVPAKSVTPPSGDLDVMVLEFAIELAKETKEKTDWTNILGSVKQNFDTALENAEAVLAGAKQTPPTVDQETIEKAWARLLEAMHYLEFKSDKTDLNKVIAMAERIDLNKYLDTGKTAFTTALEHARNVSADPDAMNEEDIKPAWKALLKAMSDLRLKPSKAELQNLKNQASFLDLNLYTKASVQSLRAALAIAETVLADDQATQEEVNDAEVRLSDALNNMVLENTAADGSITGNVNTGTNGAGSQKNTKTGDNAPFALALGLAAMSGLAIFAMRKRNSK